MTDLIVALAAGIICGEFLGAYGIWLMLADCVKRGKTIVMRNVEYRLTK